ncbi:MAG: major facilitator superfamily domain-containing protein 6 [Anaerolineae bacterium]|nr:MFS transporter [Anaerolineae bacterium]MDW8099146.1 major facilitator superfamily domain-containing protein 6 [Anaerolineae bacterium]
MSLLSTTKALVSSQLSDVTRRGLFVSRVLYFFVFAAVGAFFPYINVYYRSIGLSGTQIGLIGSLGPLVGMVAGPLWGLFSDRFGVTRPLLALAITGAMLSMLGLSIAPGFVWLLLLTAAYTFFTNPIMPLLDSTTLELLQGHRERYGRQRVWGSLGFVVTSWAFGYILERFGLRWLFYGYVALMSVVLVVAMGLPARRTRLSGPLRSGLMRLIRQRAWLFFSASLIVLGIANSGMHSFLNIYIKEMGGGEGLIGLLWGVAALSEVPVMFLAAPIIVQIGIQRTLAIAYALYAMRWLLLGIMPSPEWAVPINLLHGLTFGALWVAGVAYADALAPEELKATAQGLFSATLYSVSSVISGPISGFLFDTIGPAALFRVYAILGILALALLRSGRAR